MRSGLQRGLADLACRALQATLPHSLQLWGQAVRCETAGIPDDTKALLFALDSLCGLMPGAIASHLRHPFALPFDAFVVLGSLIMNIVDATIRSPRAVGIASAIGAVTLGLVYMMIAGAPARYLAINIGALIIGLTMLALLSRSLRAGRKGTGGAVLAMAGTLLATAVLGDGVNGAVRWVRLGGVSIQPSFILLPIMLVTFARRGNALTTAAMVAAAAAMAIQPDRAMAGMMAGALAILMILQPNRHVTSAFGASIVGLVATLVRVDRLPAAPYVDRVLYSAFEAHAAAGVAVLGGSLLLLVPAIAGWRRDPTNDSTYFVFGTVWLTAITAAAIGNYPTPIVGYGGSAIIGYALSLLALPKRASAREGTASRRSGHSDPPMRNQHLLVGLA